MSDSRISELLDYEQDDFNPQSRVEKLLVQIRDGSDVIVIAYTYEEALAVLENGGE